MHLILDIGANVGQNLCYFLRDADKVLAIEADAKSCARIQSEFESEIVQGRLKVINCAIVGHNSREHLRGMVSFYSPRGELNSVLGSLIKPRQPDEFTVNEVIAKSIIDILKEESSELDVIRLCKIDIEGYDQFVLRDLLEHGIYPEVLSFECHSKIPLNLILNSSLYHAFKVVEGASVGRSLNKTLRDNSFGRKEKLEKIDFTIHSSGPWGKDVPGPWLSKRGISLYLLLTGFGWKDVQASRLDQIETARFSGYHTKLGFEYALRRLGRKLPLSERLKSVISIKN